MPKLTTSNLIIENFNTEFIIGDSYTESLDSVIRVDIVNSDNVSVSEIGNLQIEDADIDFIIFRPNDSSLIIGECQYINTSGGNASYVLISISATETAKAKPEYTYEGRLRFLWSQSSGTDDDVRKTFKTTPFKFAANPSL